MTIAQTITPKIVMYRFLEVNDSVEWREQMYRSNEAATMSMVEAAIRIWN